METAITTYDNAPQNISTIAEDTVESKLEIVAAVNSASSLNDYVEENGTDAIIKVTDIFTMPGMRKSRDPRLPDTPCMNTYLLTTDGECLMSQSDGIYRSAAAIVSMFPTLDLGNDTDHMPMRVQSSKLKNGNTIKTLVPVRTK